MGLFHDNKIHIDREVIKDIFEGNEFTLGKFRQMIYDEVELNKFHKIIHSQKDKIMLRSCLNKQIDYSFDTGDKEEEGNRGDKAQR